MACKQCYGDLVRLGGELVCGQCGWPEKEPLPGDRPPAVHVSSLEAARRRASELEKENAALRAENADLRRQTQAAARGRGKDGR